MTLKLIHFPLTRSLRVAWAAFELDLPIAIETRVFDRAKLKEPDYLALNPLGKAPVFFDGDLRLIESVAIIEYLSQVHAGGRLSRKAGAPDYGPYLQWMEFGEAGMGGYVGMLLAHSILLPEAQRSPAMKAWAETEVANCLAFIESELGEREHLLGDFSLADISVGYIVFLVKLSRHGRLFGPRTARWLDRVLSREAWKRASALKP